MREINTLSHLHTYTKWSISVTHTLTLRLLTLVSTGGSLVLRILELVLCKLKVHEKHRRPCERSGYDSSVWSRNLRFYISSKLPGVVTLSRSCLFHITDVVPRVWTHNILKLWALTRATAPSPVTSHTQGHPRPRVSSLPLPAQDYTGRLRGDASTELLDFFTHGRVTHLPSMPALLLTGLPPASPPLRQLPCMYNWT